MKDEVNIYSETRILRSSDVNMFRRLRTSRLMEWLQEISIRHTEQLGAGKAETLDRGLLWVVTMQQIKIARMPQFDEEITIMSWPGETMHVLFPRYYKVLDAQGTSIISGSAIWMLVDSTTRKCGFPEKYGIHIPGITTGEEIALPTPIQREEWNRSFAFEVPFRYVDLNGHMNNTCYFDLVEDKIVNQSVTNELQCIDTEYSSELCYQEKAEVQWCQKENQYFICGTGARNYFKMNLRYQ